MTTRRQTDLNFQKEQTSLSDFGDEEAEADE